MLNTMLNIAIIGGGPSAACVIDAISHHRSLAGRVNVTVFEPSPLLWRGQVFQPDGDEVLSNVPMDIMSLRPSDRQHGVRWLQKRGYDGYSDTLFPPRWLVGRYLQQSSEQAVAALEAAGSSVRIEPRKVGAIEERESKLWAQGERWSRGPFDHVVLCPGAPSSYDPYHLAGQPGYIQNPYPMRLALENIPGNARVAVIGSGLTAVDATMGLRARGHQGPITLVSRNGILPCVRGAPVKHSCRHLTVANVEALARRDGGLRVADMVALAQAELRDAGLDPATVAASMRTRQTAFQQLQDDLERAGSCDAGWAMLRSGMIGCGQHAWFLLPKEEKDLVRAHHPLLMRLLCPMPFPTAGRLMEMFGTGQLEVIPGVTSVRVLEGQEPSFRISAARDLVADVVIGASTPATREPSPMTRPLFASLVSAGLAVPNPFGGLSVDLENSRLIDSSGVANPRLHAVGDITNGSYLFTFGLSIFADRGAGIVEDIARSLRPAEPSHPTGELWSDPFLLQEA